MSGPATSDAMKKGQGLRQLLTDLRLRRRGAGVLRLSAEQPRGALPRAWSHARALQRRGEDGKARRHRAERRRARPRSAPLWPLQADLPGRGCFSAPPFVFRRCSGTTIWGPAISSSPAALSEIAMSRRTQRDPRPPGPRGEPLLRPGRVAVRHAASLPAIDWTSSGSLAAGAGRSAFIWCRCWPARWRGSFCCAGAALKSRPPNPGRCPGPESPDLHGPSARPGFVSLRAVLVVCALGQAASYVPGWRRPDIWAAPCSRAATAASSLRDSAFTPPALETAGLILAAAACSTLASRNVCRTGRPDRRFSPPRPSPRRASS